MADGAGGLIANLMMGNPMGQLSQALAGPSASPQAAQGGSGCGRDSPDPLRCLSSPLWPSHRPLSRRPI